MEIKNIERMLLGIGLILFSYTLENGELFSLFGLIITISGYFDKQYKSLISYFLPSESNDSNSENDIGD